MVFAGGISYLSARYGFACDHVENFQVSGLRSEVSLWRGG